MIMNTRTEILSKSGQFQIKGKFFFQDFKILSINLIRE